LLFLLVAPHALLQLKYVESFFRKPPLSRSKTGRHRNPKAQDDAIVSSEEEEKRACPFFQNPSKSTSSSSSPKVNMEASAALAAA